MVSFKWSAIDVMCAHLLGDSRLLWVVEQAWEEYSTIAVRVLDVALCRQLRASVCRFRDGSH